MRRWRLREVEPPAQGRPAESRPQASSPHACAAPPLLTWVVGEVLGLAPFPLPVDDVEVDLDRGADVLVSVFRDLNEKHVLEGRSSVNLTATGSKFLPEAPRTTSQPIVRS